MDQSPNRQHPKYAPTNQGNTGGISRRLPTLALLHAILFVLFLSWGFGGNALWLRPAQLLFGSLALPLTLALLLPGQGVRSTPNRLWLLLLPLAALDLLVLASLLNPLFKPVTAWGITRLVQLGGHTWLPGCARATDTAAALWLTNCVYLTGFNLFAFVRRRSRFRVLLAVLALNAALLAAFGTLQKLTHADGLYFGLVPSSNPTFFASFVYHNHWGAFAILCLCASLGLMWHFTRRADTRYRDFFHSPSLLFLAAALLIAVTPPLSSSRSCTLLMLLVAAGATVHAIRHLRRRLPHSPLRFTLPALAVLASLAAIFWLAEPVVRTRLNATRTQLSEMREQGGMGSRAELYRDTLRLAADRPLFGWGKGSYPVAFYHYNNQRPNPLDRLPNVYADAHSDWLQCLAELGLVGATLMALTALVPLWSVRTTLLDSNLSRWLLIGCALILLYAWVEFPFGNPAVTLVWWTLFFTALRYPQAD